MNNALMDVAAGLVSGAIKVVDLSVTLKSDTPILQLPEEFGWKSIPHPQVTRPRASHAPHLVVCSGILSSCPRGWAAGSGYISWVARCWAVLQDLASYTFPVKRVGPLGLAHH